MKEKSKVKILLVDDEPANIWQLVEHLERDYEILSTTSGKKALDIIFSELPDIILLDIVMPDIDGFEILNKIKSNEITKKISVIFLTGKNDSIDETKGLEAGAQDYITKPFSIPVVKARIKSIISLKKELEKRQIIKENLEYLNNELEQQVKQKQFELKQAQQALVNYENRYYNLFAKRKEIIESKKILVVDDNPENIHILAENLESDYEVIHATNGQKALNIAFSDSNRPDLILLDVMMPEMDGFEVCSKLKANSETWDIPIIFVTSLTHSVSETKGLELGAVDFITKPFSIPVVKARLKTHLNLKNELEKRLYLTRELETLNHNMEQTIKEKTGELKQAYEDLKNSEKKYRDIFENAIEGIFQSTPSGQYLSANPAMAKIFGFESSAELIAETKDISQQIYADPQDRKVFLNALETESKILNFEFQFNKKTGEKKWASVCASSIYDSKGKLAYYQGFVSDITKQKQAEEQKKELEKKLQKTQRLESIGTLAEGIAHDFNNILSGILGFAQLAQIHVSDKIKLQKDIENIIKSGHKAAELVQQILTFSRKTLNKKRPVSLKSIILDALNIIRSSIPSTIEIKQDLKTSKLIMADPTQLHQIVMNLCTNAYHAMENKTYGTITVCLDEEKSKMNFSDNNKNDFVRLSIADTGDGIIPEILEKIFDPYFTTKKPGKGTGLGLAVVHGIVEDHKGFIEVSSSPKKGTEFNIFFPVSNKSGENKTQETFEKNSKPNEDILKNKKKILLVDDEPKVLESTQLLLENFGFEVEAFSNGKDAFEEFKKNSQYEIIITDMTMPGYTGDELASKISDMTNNVLIILCSGYSEKKISQKVKNNKSVKILQKPFQIQDIIKIIKDNA